MKRETLFRLPNLTYIAHSSQLSHFSFEFAHSHHFSLLHAFRLVGEFIRRTSSSSLLHSDDVLEDSSRCLTPHRDSSHTQPLGRLFKQHTIRWSISFPYNVDVFSFCPFAILMRSDDDDVWSENILWVRVSALALILSPMLKYHRSTYVYSINLIHYIPTYSRTLSINRRRTKLLFLFLAMLYASICEWRISKYFNVSCFLIFFRFSHDDDDDGLAIDGKSFSSLTNKEQQQRKLKLRLSTLVSLSLILLNFFRPRLTWTWNCVFFCVVNIWGDSCFMYTPILWLAMLCNFEILAFQSTVTVNINWRRWKGPWTTWIGKSRWKSENLYIYLQRCARLVVVIPSHLIHSASSSILSLSLSFLSEMCEKS